MTDFTRSVDSGCIPLRLVLKNREDLSDTASRRRLPVGRQALTVG